MMENLKRNQFLTASTIQGAEVRTPSDEEIGEIKDVMIDMSTGEISYAVLSVSTGFLNLESKYFAVAWGALNFDNCKDDNYQESVIILDVSKEKLEQSPGFDKDNWPIHADSEFIDSVNSYYGVEDKRNYRML